MIPDLRTEHVQTKHVETSSRQRWLLAVVSIAGILFLLVAIFFGSFAWLSTRPQAPTSPTPVTEWAVPVNHQVESEQIAQQYMTACIKQQYKTMWAMLHPQVQAMWPSEAAFAKFWSVRFRDYTLQGFVAGNVHGLLYWVNPETMVVYHHVVLIHISLQLQPDATVAQAANAPPEDLHPNEVFRNLPFIIQQVDSQDSQQSHWLVLDGGPVDLEAPILPPVHPVDTMVKVPILMYHHISDAPPTNLLELSLTVTPTHFTQQLDYLKTHDYHTITFNQLFDALYHGGPLPAHPIILTFDDGYEDAYQFAFPILQAHGFSGTFYIITGVVGWRGYLNWDQLHSMLAAGMQIGSHTIHHVNIGATLLFSLTAAQQELLQSQAVLQKQLGVVIQQFCYPSGEPFRHGSLALRQRIVVLLAADSYIGATTDPGQTGIYQSSLSPFALLRVRVDGRESFAAFTESVPPPSNNPTVP